MGLLAGGKVLVVGAVDQTDTISVIFDDTEHAINLLGCPEIMSLLVDICPNWPFRTLANSVDNCFLQVRKVKSKYELSSQFMESVKAYSDPLDAACAIVVELAWATLRANPDWLCLHSAAAEFNGRLVLFPNSRRSGKSTLTTLLGLRGHRVFTDDFLAVEIIDQKYIAGISSGVASRMRRPWPEEFTVNVQKSIANSAIAENHQYTYHTSPGNMPIERGQRLPIGAIVTLSRGGVSEPKLSEVGIQHTLRTVILQNFSRAVHSSYILQVLFAVVSQAKLFELNYTNAEDAVALLEDTLGSWDVAPPQLASPVTAAGNSSASLTSSITDVPIYSDFLEKSASVVEYEIESIRFLADPKGSAILQLDEMSSAIWKLLEKPIKLSEIVALFCEAFPDVERDTISADVENLVRELWRCGLLKSK